MLFNMDTGNAYTIEKPRVRIAVYPGTEVQVGDNVTLSCVMDNLFDLRSLTWLKDDTILPFRSTELCITDAQTRDAGIYKCSVVNQWGEGYSYVTFNVKEKTHPYDVNDVTYLTSQWTNTSERYDNGKRQQTPFLLIIASGTSFVIVSILLASSVVIYRRSHGAVQLESVNPNSENPPPNRSDNVEYETIDELQDGILPHQNVPSGIAASTMEIATVEIFTHSKSNSTSADDSSLRSLRSLSDYINPYCSLNAEVIHKKNEYDFVQSKL